ncbi:MAG TPA: 1,4-alpha-glucan branching protein GlgB [bacterium]|nr:1,4-alpha-glucan branching protein GlgB [bacterium]
MDKTVVSGKSLFTEKDIYHFKEGSHFRLYEKMGAHEAEFEGRKGVFFSVWAPNASCVSVIGRFNNWQPGSHRLFARADSSGIWEGFVEGMKKGELYKYKIDSSVRGYSVEKGDPYGFFWEIAPKTASIVWGLEYEWADSEWMKSRHEKNSIKAPMSVYEVHLGSWRKKSGVESLSYRELAVELTEYVLKTGFTHVELMPVMEHPFYGSWGYQTGGYFAPTSRFGTPQDFMFLIDSLHRAGIGVILDWVPSHFPTDEYGLGFFDGTHLYEHEDKRKGFHPDWKSAIFNYGRNEVKNFLISNALFWLDKYHADGLRVDAVASMLYLDYSRKEGEWEPNKYGGNENIEAIEFLKRFNETVYGEYPGTQTIAEESTAWPMVSKPVYTGGLGFGLKWNMGWMNDTLSYISEDPVYRKYNHDKLTFSLMYAFSENFMLPFSHDEVVHGKGSLAGKMPGDDWQKMAGVRALLGYMYAHPGKKTLFMGCEIGQWAEWDFNGSVDWAAAETPLHAGVQKWTGDLNRVYKSQPALYERDFTYEGFRWIDCRNFEESVISFIRKGENEDDDIVIVCNFTPVARHHYTLGFPSSGFWDEILNSDAKEYGGSGAGNYGGVHVFPFEAHGMGNSATLTVPPLGVLFFKKRVNP